MSNWDEQIGQSKSDFASCSARQHALFALACANHAFAVHCERLQTAVAEGHLGAESLQFVADAENRLWELLEEGAATEDALKISQSLRDLEADEDSPDLLVPGWVHLFSALSYAAKCIVDGQNMEGALHASQLAYHSVLRSEMQRLHIFGIIDDEVIRGVEQSSEACQAEVNFQVDCLHRIAAGKDIQRLPIQ